MEDKSGGGVGLKPIALSKRPLAQYVCLCPKMCAFLIRPGIIAVHGLNGSWDGTWTNPNEFFWLRDGLPQYCPDCNILSANLSIDLGPSNPLFIEEPAKRLITHMMKVQSQLPSLYRNIPIVFLAEGTGDFIVKKVCTNEEFLVQWH
jgi:hypothetical protein